MSTRWFTRSQWTPQRRMLYRVALTLALLALLIGLARSGLAKFKPSNAAARDDFPQLDSFSEPALAVTLLKTKADRFFYDYDQYLAAHPPNTSAFFGSTPAPQDSPLARLQKLHQQIEDLDANLDRTLMTVASLNSGSEKEFLERYLDRLGTHGEDPFLVFWVSTALRCAEENERTGELLDALQHFTGFHPELKTSTNLARVVQEWQATTGRSPDVGSP